MHNQMLHLAGTIGIKYELSYPQDAPKPRVFGATAD